MFKNQGLTKLQIIFFISLAIIFIKIFADLLVNILWFQELNYLSVFWEILKTKLIYGLLTGVISFLFLHYNFNRALQLKWPKSLEKYNFNSSELKPQSQAIDLPPLLIILSLFALIISSLVVYSTQVAYETWRIDYTLPKVTPSLTNLLENYSLRAIIDKLATYSWKVVLVIILMGLLLKSPRFFLRIFNLVITLVFSLIIAGNWTLILQFLYANQFDKTDPQFGQDIAFYIFTLPVLQLIYLWAAGLVLYSIAAISLLYLLSGDSLAKGKFPGFSRPQLRHLYGLTAVMGMIIAFHHWLTRYQLLYSQRGVTYGASYTDINIQMPLEIVLSFISIGISLWLLWKAITGAGRNNLFLTQFFGRQNKLGRRLYRIPFSPWPFYIYLIVFFGNIMSCFAVQSFVVQPNELERERPYIERSIKYTRQGFDLDKIERKTFNPEEQLTYQIIQQNSLTVDNIRLWDTRPLLETNRQLQQIRPYYHFIGADIDRYTIRLSDNDQEINSKKQQTIISARELDYNDVPKQAQTWVNEHLVYTHGYGFTLSPVNLVDEGGLPYYFVKDIGILEEGTALRTSSELINYSIPIGKPRIYYGELTNTYVMTSTEVQEFDFPSGQENVYNVYDGTGGIKLDSYWRRLIFAIDLGDWQMLFTNNFTPDTKLLMRRNINMRLRKIAPFLRYDQDPYLVVADGGDSQQGQSANYLHWIIDAYTTSSYYPYSDPLNYQFNYIRNSVKIVVDAYNGDVQFYIADANDPIIQTWQKVFGDIFHPLDDMPDSLKSHIRYPQDYFNTQSDLLLNYHMLDPQVFYNREDQWRIPSEIYGYESREVEPYYLIIKLPTTEKEQFMLVNLYTPVIRNNLIAILFGLSDGKDYGRLVIYTLPKQRLVYGTEQIEARINQDPVISQQISLWNREGSKAVQGNLLVIPIENSLLYVEPLYLEAEQNSLPTLVRVILVYGNRIVMAESLDKGLRSLFEDTMPTETTPIIRPLEENNVEQ